MRAAEITVKICSMDESGRHDYNRRVKGGKYTGGAHQMLYESLAGRQEKTGKKKRRKLILQDEFPVFL